MIPTKGKIMSGNRFTRTLLASTAPNWPWMCIFAALAGVVLWAAIRMPYLSPTQQFYFRICMAIAASGMGGIIPGFLEINLRWARNGIRACGATGFFVAIYMLNPPNIQDPVPPPPVPDFSGNWTYRCNAIDVDYKHGGVCTLEAKAGEYGIGFNISGTRQWRQYSNAPVQNITFNWHSKWGILTDSNRFQFEYEVEKNNGIIHGFAWGDIKYENGKPFSLSGNFYQVPPTDPLFGFMTFTKDGTGPANQNQARLAN
jgi:hypothetical protein